MKFIRLFSLFVSIAFVSGLFGMEEGARGTKRLLENSTEQEEQRQNKRQRVEHTIPSLSSLATRELKKDFSTFNELRNQMQEAEYPTNYHDTVAKHWTKDDHPVFALLKRYNTFDATQLDNESLLDRKRSNSNHYFVTGYIRSASWSPDDNYVATVSGDSTVRVWDGATGKQVHCFQAYNDNKIMKCVEWSPDGNYIVAGSEDGSVLVLDAKTYDIVHELKEHEDAVNCICWCSNSGLFATGSVDTTVRVWQVATGKCVQVFKEQHTNEIESIIWSGDGTYLVTLNEEEAVIWNTLTGRVVKKFEGEVRRVALCPTKQMVVLSMLLLPNKNEALILCDMKNEWASVGEGYFPSLAWSPDGTFLAAGTYRNMVYIYSVKENGLELATTIYGTRSVISDDENRDDAYDEFIQSIWWSSDGKSIITAHNFDNTIEVWDVPSEVWDVATRRLIQTLSVEEAVADSNRFPNERVIVFSPQGNCFMTGFLGSAWICKKGEEQLKILQELKEKGVDSASQAIVLEKMYEILSSHNKTLADVTGAINGLKNQFEARVSEDKKVLCLGSVQNSSAVKRDITLVKKDNEKCVAIVGKILGIVGNK